MVIGNEKGKQASLVSLFRCSMPISDFYTITFEGILCASSTPKIKSGTALKFMLEEKEENEGTHGFLEKRKETQVRIYLKKGYIFSISDYIKDGSIKYARLSGGELFRGWASISNVAFSSYIDEEEATWV